MPGFCVKLKVKDARLLYRTAAATLAIEEGIPFRMFAQPSFRCLFTPLNLESDRIVNLNHQEVRDSVMEMGEFAIEATKREIPQLLFPHIYQLQRRIFNSTVSLPRSSNTAGPAAPLNHSRVEIKHLHTQTV